MTKTRDEGARALPDPEQEPTISVPRAARILGIGNNSAYNAIERGEIPSLRIGKRIVVPTAALRRMLADLGGEPK